MWYCEDCKKNRDVITFIGEESFDRKTSPSQIEKIADKRLGFRCAECDSRSIMWE